ncbi:MAG TPA: sigma-70 family RNA polymerase sigma factor [Gaiellales bacterium]
MAGDRPTPHEELVRMSDAQLVAHARERMATGEAGVATAKRCVALVFERHRGLVRAICAAKAPIDVVDDLEADVYLRFVRAVYLRSTPIGAPAGLLSVMAQRVVASFHDRRKPAGVSLDEADDVAAAEDGYDQVAAAEVAEQLLAVLSDRQREVVWGRVWDDLTSAEIAVRMQTTPGNVDVIFFRAMRRLEEELGR